MSTRYRIVRDAYAGYEAQSWRWWFPFWVQMGGTNTHMSIEQARAYIARRSRGVVEHVNAKGEPVVG